MATFKKYAQKLKKNKGQKLIIMLLISSKPVLAEPYGSVTVTYDLLMK